MDKNTPKSQTEESEIGYVVSVNNYILWLNGLPNVKINEIIQNQESVRAIVTSIKEDLVEALVLDDAKIKPQDSFRRTNNQLMIKAGPHLFGRAINPLGQPIDGKSGFGNFGEMIEMGQIPPGIKARDQITDQFVTGVTLVDMLIPLAFGQRELIIGDNHSGKTGFLLDTVINQKDKDVICIYALIGKPINTIKNILDALKNNQTLSNTIVVSTNSSERASLVYLTPFTAMSIAEYFQKQGKNVLIVLDDLGLHAKFYREISLLSNKPPGRDSYPGDIFYQHARLIERAGKFSQNNGGGSITALPVIETILDDFSSYMTTNLMGMTDGHLLFSATRYHQGYRPSVDIFLSVSRVGRQTQNIAQKTLADKIKALLLEANKLQAYSRLGSDLSPQTLFTLKQGQQIESILKQSASSNIDVTVQTILLALIFTPFFSEKETSFVSDNKQKIVSYLSTPEVLKNLQTRIPVMHDDKELIEMVKTLIPALEKAITNN